MLRWGVLTWESDEGFLEGSIEELGVAMCSLNDLSEECACGRRTVLLILGRVRGRVEQRHSEMNRCKLRVAVLFSQGHSILHGLLGTVCKVHAAIHDCGVVL
jgi:hypothetical protein